MKTTKLFLAILISLFGFLNINQIKADTIYVDLDTVINYQTLTFCQNDTIRLFDSQYTNPVNWTKYDIVTMFGRSPYITITENSVEYLFTDSCEGTTTWTTWSGNTNGLWKLTKFVGAGAYVFFYIYFTTPHTEHWTEIDREICGTADTLYASPDSYQTGVRYTWFLNGDTVADGYYPSDTSYIVTHSGQYVLRTTGCNTISDTINIAIIDNTPPDLGSDWEFCGDNHIVDFSLYIADIDPDGIYQSWEWSNGTTGSLGEPGGEFIHITYPSTYWIEVNNACLSGVRDSIEVTHVSYPDIQILGQTSICPGGSTQLCTNFSYDVTVWAKITNTDTTMLSQMTDCVTISDSMIVSVYVREGQCPSEIYEKPVTMTTPYQNNQICVVTVDYELGKTKVVWEKMENMGIEKYNIYKKVSITNDYGLVGTVPISDEPEFIDMTSNPTSQAYTYKITAVDTCGGESEMSPFHKSIFIVHSEYQGSLSVTISGYEDESGNYIPSQYYLLEDTTGTGSNFRIIDSTINTLLTNVNPFPGAYYLVGISQPLGCGHTKTKNSSINNLILSNKLDI